LINKFLFLLQESFRSLVRTKIPTIVSSLAIAVSLFIVSIAYCLYLSFQDLTIDFKDKYSIEVFFVENLNEEKAISEFENILLMDQIEGGNFINKDKAADIFRNEFDEDIVDILGENPLPLSAVYTISELARDYESIQNIISNIETLKSVDVVLYEKDAIIKFDKLVRNIMIFIFAISFFIILVVIFFVSNTILLVIYSKKEDIQTYRLLGATPSFIKLPYLLEGMIHGLIGSVISILLLMLLYNLLQYFLSSLLGIMNYDIISIVLLNVFLGMFLGFLGSSKALSSYIRD
jgi:cell division transport system permease protein